MLLLGLLSLMGLGLATVMLPSPEEDEAQINTLLKTAKDELEAASKDGTTELLENVKFTVDTDDTEATEDTETAEEIAEIQEAYEELPKVYKLTAVKNHDGTIYNPSFAVSKGPDSGEDANRDFVFNGSDLPHRIVTQYDTGTSFLVQPNEKTLTLPIGLNANVEEPEPTLTSAGEPCQFVNAPKSPNCTDHPLFCAVCPFLPPNPRMLYRGGCTVRARFCAVFPTHPTVRGLNLCLVPPLALPFNRPKTKKAHPVWGTPFCKM